ncbi:hypothetical protein HPB47_021374 [Ixodes persulcatus]|uniref:Uncharacterized protein n=1 Tax=Ixodes persulcatus TaxID=34615 RepID=A0AC60QCV3_IXOPE|nr:hypothetical protein HPB47_021374 [Ixodes persulcatus]
MFAQPSITHRRRCTADESTTPTMTLTYVRKDLPTTQEDTTQVNTHTARTRNHHHSHSDHHILELCLQISSCLRRTTATYPRTKITDWSKARADLDTVNIDTLSPEAWSTAIFAAIQQQTKEIARTEDHPHVDSHLLSLWDKRCALVKRCRHCKLNTTLQARIQALNYECKEYADHLAIQHWLDLRNNFNGQLHTPSCARGTIIEVDLKKAFDNVAHAAILYNLQETQPGSRLFNYIKDFLSERTAQIIVPSGQPSPPFPISRSTPQGSILSPTLFNLTMKNLPPKLSSFPDLCHAIYADDVTIWCSRGSSGTQKHTLQDNLNIIQTHAQSISL